MTAFTGLNRAIATTGAGIHTEQMGLWDLYIEFPNPCGGEPILEVMELSLPVGMTPHDLLLTDFDSDQYGTPATLMSDYRGIFREDSDC